MPWLNRWYIITCMKYQFLWLSCFTVRQHIFKTWTFKTCELLKFQHIHTHIHTHTHTHMKLHQVCSQIFPFDCFLYCNDSRCDILLIIYLSSLHFQTTGLTPIEQIKQGMRLEVQHCMHPKSVWIVQVLENVGGRLLLRYEGTESATHDFWLFYLSHRIHPIGWAPDHGCIYKPPEGKLPEREIFTSKNQ